MTLAIGTTNPGKLQSVARALADYPTLSTLKTMPVKVDSGVADQPSTLEETTTGATNRAKRAMKDQGTTFGIGMESGLFEQGGKMFDVCACVIYDGENTHVGYSCAWELPNVVTKLFKEQNMNLTDAFNKAKICDDPKIGDKGGVIKIVTGGRVTRPDYTVQAIQMALAAMDPKSYTCGRNVPEGINEPATAGSIASGRAFMLGVVAGVSVAALVSSLRRSS